MISTTEFRNGISDESIRASQAIHIAMGLGVVAFLAATIFLSSQFAPVEGADDSLVRTLCMILAVFAFGAYTAAVFIFNRGFSNMKLFGGMSAPDGRVYAGMPAIFVRKLQVLQIIRLALFEGVAFFGITICLLAGQLGIVQAQPVYWLAASPAVLVLALAASTFPTKDRIVAMFEEYQMTKSNT